jgi:hypothetical protein
MRKILPFLLASAALHSAPALAQDAMAQQIAELRAQMQTMQAQLDKLEAEKAAASAAPVPAAAGPTPSEKPAAPSWTASTTISGKVFANVSSIDQKSDGADAAQSGTQAELKRFYIGIDHKFDDTFSANLTTDFRYGSNGTTKDTLIYVKKAYLQARFAPEFFVRVGAADLPWVPFTEGVYGYRFVENILVDRTKFGTSSDWGVHIGGTFGNNLVSYAFSAINGAGYKTLSRSSDTIDLEGRISVTPIKNVVLAVGGYSGKLGKSAANLPDTATPHRATRWNALAAYTGPRLRVGAEYFQARNWNNVTTVASDKSDGWSAFGSFAFTPKISAFGRYDWVHPAKLTNAALKDHYFNFGLDYKPIKPLDVALVYKRDKVENGLLATANGTIGGTDQGTYDEIGIFTQAQF